jgi:rubrerythrin
VATLFNADEVYQVAINVESNAVAFYRAAAKRSADPESRGMYADLAEWEGGHVTVLADLRGRLDANARAHTPADPAGEVTAYLQALAAGAAFRKDRGLESLLDKCRGPLEVLGYAIRFEQEAIRFFGTMKGLVPEYLGASAIDRLIAEEQQHLSMLKGKVYALSGGG